MKLLNFRGIERFDANMKNNMLCIIGKNDVGKSAALRAVSIFFELQKFAVEDIPVGQQPGKSVIEIHFELNDTRNGFQSNDVLSEYEMGTLVLRQTYDWSNFSSIVRERYNAEQDSWDTVTAAQWSLYRAQFPEIIFIPVSQDHSNEQRMTNDTSVFGQVFRKGLKRLLKQHQDFEKHLQKVTFEIEKINAMLIDKVESKLNENSPFQIQLKQEIPPIDLIKGFTFNMKVQDQDGVETYLTDRGSGLQRSVLMAVLRAQSEIDQLSFEADEQDHEYIAEPNVLYLFEEPEAFLHLQAQRELFYLLKNDLAREHQVIVTTHSSMFMDESDLDDVVLLRKENGRTVSSQAVSDDELRIDLGEVRLSDLISAKVCCFVEGPTDKKALEMWSKTLGCDYRQAGIVFVSMNGCAMANYFANVSVVNAFDLPFMIVLDKDYENSTTNKNINKLRRYLKDLKGDPENFLVILEKGAIENYYPLDIVANVMNVSRENINDTFYLQKPKEAIREASNGRFKDISDKYIEKICAQMAPETIDPEIHAIFDRLLSKSQRVDHTKRSIDSPMNRDLVNV